MDGDDSAELRDDGRLAELLVGLVNPLPSPERRMELYAQENRRVRRLALDLIQQTLAYERQDGSGEINAVRFLLIRNMARDLFRAARRPARRYIRARGTDPRDNWRDW